MSRDVIYIEECDPGLRVAGCGCEWSDTGTTDTMLTCDDAILTAGDASPAGRCPECLGLVYLDRPEDRARDAAPAMLEALRDLVEWAERTGGWEAPCWDRARDAIAKAGG